MSDANMTVALVHDVFHDRDGPLRLRDSLERARQADAVLALLPELPLNKWSPAVRTVRDEDAEPPEGPRHQLLSKLAQEVGIGICGGVIVRETNGRRLNRALVFDAAGILLGRYDKAHLPAEEGFWESDHYEPGNEPAKPVVGFPLILGLQVCSDLQRPTGCQQLRARGAEVILGPRATPPASYERWRLVIRANALTSGSYVLSTNRPAPELGVEIGGPSLAVGPDGQVLAESTEPLAFVRLHREAVARARSEYPGYLDMRDSLYARGWSEIATD